MKVSMIYFLITVLHLVKKVSVFFIETKFTSASCSKYSPIEKEILENKIQIGTSASIVNVLFPHCSEIAIIRQGLTLGFGIRSNNRIKYFTKLGSRGVTHAR